LALVVDPTKMEGRGYLNASTMKQRMFVITLDDSYPASGYDCDLAQYCGWRIDDNMSSSFGGWMGEVDTINKKLHVHRAGVEAPVGTSFYDATLGQYGKLLIWVFQLGEYYDQKGKQPENLLANPPVIVDALTLNGVAQTQMIRKDVNDTTGPGVTTTIPATSSMKVEGSITVEPSASYDVSGTTTIKSGGTQVVESGGSTTVQSGGTQTLASGATAINSGKVVNVTNMTFASGDDTPNVANGNQFVVDGSITPSLTDFDGGSDGQVIGIFCSVSSCVISYDATKISLKGKANVTMSAGDSISFRLVGTVWNEIVSSIKDGSAIVASGGTITVTDGAKHTNESGSTVVNAGVTINVPASISASTPDASKNTIFDVSSDDTGTITDFLNPTANQYIFVNCTKGNVTISHNANIKLKESADWIMQTNDTITLQYKSGVWVEIQRNVYSGRVGGNLLPLTFGANIAINATNSNAYSLVTTGDCTLTITGGNPGWTIVLLITNDAIGPHVVAFGSGFRAGGSLVGQTDKVASLTFNYDGTSWFESSRKENL